MSYEELSQQIKQHEKESQETLKRLGIDINEFNQEVEVEMKKMNNMTLSEVIQHLKDKMRETKINKF